MRINDRIDMFNGEIHQINLLDSACVPFEAFSVQDFHLQWWGGDLVLTRKTAVRSE